MNNKWKKIPKETAERHPLYGIDGWLLVFIITNLLGLLFNFVQSSILTELNSYTSSGTGIVLSFNFFFTATIIALIYCKHSQFRNIASVMLVSSWPVLFLILTASFDELVTIRTAPNDTLRWIVQCCIWVTYLQRSERVRVTFEHCVRASMEDRSVNNDGLASQNNQNQTPPASERVHNRSVPTIQPLVTNNDSVRLIEDTSPSNVRNQSSPRAAAPMTIDKPSHTPEADEALWEKALGEFESQNRRRGLWARAFATAQGNENAAKANYLRERVAELVEERAIEAARLAKIESEIEDEREMIRLAAIARQSSDARIAFLEVCAQHFVRGTHAHQSDIELAARRYQSGTLPTPEEVAFLAGASTRDSSLATISDRLRAQTLLHWAANFDLEQAARALLAAGADPDAPNGDGRTARELAMSPATLAAILQSGRSK